MSNDEKYRAWKERPLPLDISADFAGDVLRRIYRQMEQRQEAQPSWLRLLEFFQRSRALQLGVLAIAAVAGLSRFWLMFFIILEPSTN